MSREQEFLNAARTGDQKTFLNILNDQSINIDPNITHKYGNTALILAAQEGHREIISALLTNERVNPNYNYQSNTALSGAAYLGHVSIVNILLADERVNPDHADGQGYTALIWAAKQGRGDIVKALLAHPRTDPNHANHRGETTLTSAAHGIDNVFNILLDHPRIDPNHANHRGETVLIWAATHGMYNIVNILLAHFRIDPNRADEHGNTSLIWASRNGHSDIVRALLAHPRIDPNYANHRGRTALILAGHIDVVNVLLNNTRIDLSYAGQAKKAMIKASRHQDENTLKMLLRYSNLRPNSYELATLSTEAQGFYRRILRETKVKLRMIFCGLVGTIVSIRHMRLRVAKDIYGPGGTGYVAAAASFASSAKSLTKKNLEENCEFNKSSRKKPKVVALISNRLRYCVQQVI